MTTTYRVIAERDGHGWRVRVDGVGGLAGVQARDLADIEPRVRKLLWSYTGKVPADIELDVEVRLPPAIQVRLDLSRQLVDEAKAEMGGAVDEMLAAKISVGDVDTLMEDCQLPRQLTITNGEIAREGLSQHPLALGLRWDDHGRFVTLLCRDCVEALRFTYLDLPPDERSILLYNGPIRCDSCHEDHPPEGEP